jgi:hypothetical protein
VIIETRTTSLRQPSTGGGVGIPPPPRETLTFSVRGVAAPNRFWRRWLLCAVVGLGLLPALVGCANTNEPRAEYKPPLLPVKLEITPSGVSVTGDATIVTFLGTFSVGAKYSMAPPGEDTVRVLVLNRNKGPTGFHDIFDVRTGGGRFVAVTNGKTVIQVMDRMVQIDVTDGTVEEISFKTIDGELPKSADEDAVSPWRAYWEWSPYHPFGLSRWAYDDSAMSKWYGVGFVWFLVRLCVAILLGLVDLVLTLVFLVAGVFDVLVGETARNIAFGVFALIGVWLVLRSRPYLKLIWADLVRRSRSAMKVRGPSRQVW